MNVWQGSSRRRFLRSMLWAGAGFAGHGPLLRAVNPPGPERVARSRVALTAGEDHADNVYRALRFFRREIATAIGSRQILIKPNVVIGTPDNGHGDVELSDTSALALEGILEFLKSIGRTQVMIAESTATDPTFVGFESLGYFELGRRYGARLLDLNQEPYDRVDIYRGTATAQARVSRLLSDPDVFTISAAQMKTHNCVVATLSLKNVLMASPVIDLARYDSLAGSASDKDSMHGSSNQDLNDNLHRLASRLAPDLAVIDGYRTMEGRGPCWGRAVEHRVAVASLDWLAADRVGLELMGIDSGWPAYLNYCAQTGLGQFDLNSIDVLGEDPSAHRRKYALYDNCYETQVRGMRATPRV